MTDTAYLPSRYQSEQTRPETTFQEQMAPEYPLRLQTRPDVFSPTSTTWQLIAQVLKSGVRGKAVLDLGCGSGPIAISLALAGAGHVYASDLMTSACELARENVRANFVEDRVTVVQGDLFDPVCGMRFDVIVDDVSGVAEDVARYSAWFPEGVPLGGSDGTLLTIRVLRSAGEHLRPGGLLYFPVLSLSASHKVLEVASDLFGDRLSRVASKRIPFSEELRDHLDSLTRLRQEGVISFEQVRSRHFWTLDIYCATAPNE